MKEQALHQPRRLEGFDAQKGKIYDVPENCALPLILRWHSLARSIADTSDWVPLETATNNAVESTRIVNMTQFDAINSQEGCSRMTLLDFSSHAS